MEFVGISGMSYHGGMLGAFIAGLIFTRREKINTWLVVNLGFLCAPVGYTWGRLGNFLNGELYGRPTESGWGMLFPADMSQLRHPSQVYEMVFEGPVLFAIQFALWRSNKLKEHMFSTYLMGYGTARFFIEYFREPDAHIGLQGGLSRGQYLCVAMVVGGLLLMMYRNKQLKKIA